MKVQKKAEGKETPPPVVFTLRLPPEEFRPPKICIPLQWPSYFYPNMNVIKLHMACVLGTLSVQGQQPVPDTLLCLPGYEAAYPRIFSDETRLLFQSNAKGNWQLMVLDLNTRAVTPVFTDRYNNNFPDLSPDNTQIAFVSDRDGNEEIYLCATDGSRLRRLTRDPGRDIHPYFSPDGRYLLFNSTRGNGSLDIYRYDLLSDSVKRLSDYPDDETCARYSPDMKQIVYLRNGIAGDDVYLMKAAGFVSENLSATPARRDGWPMFSADGKWICYSAMEQGRFSIVRKRLSDGKIERLTAPGAGEQDGRVFVAPSGKWMAFNRDRGKTIMLMRAPLTN